MTCSPFSRLTASFARPAFFVLTVLAAIALLGFDTKRAQATVYFVTTTGTGNGSTWAMAGPLQTIITAAHSGDQVWVKFGTYTGNFTATDGVAVYGHFAGTETSLTQRQLTDPNFTTALDGNSSGTVYTIPSSATKTNTFDGFTVQHGNSSSDGGGLYNNSRDTLVIANCTFTNNSANGEGGGIRIFNNTASVTNCTFSNNIATGFGGGFCADGSVASLTDCNFTGNQSITGAGGGINGGSNGNAGSYTITGCTFTDNSAHNVGGAINEGAGDGSLVPSTVQDCAFTSNSPSAVFFGNTGSASTPTVVKDCLIVGNGTTSSDELGIQASGFNDGTAYITIANNTIVNTYEGIVIDISSSTGAIKVANNILDGNGGGLNYAGTIPFTSSHNDVYGNVSYGYQGVSLSSSDLQVNPMFVSAANDDYQLEDTSPLINAGDNSYVLSGDKDLLGNPRIESTAVDIGAYEYTLIPTITSFTPTSGPFGTVVTVTGTNLENLISVRFHNANAKTFSVNGSGTQVTVTVPSGAGTGTFTVTTLGGAVTTKTPFTVTVLVKSLAFSPTTIAPGGSSTGTVTLTSPAPTGGAVVVITEGAFAFQVATVTIAAGQTTGTFTATATASAPAGAYPFTATYNKSSASATLTVN